MKRSNPASPVHSSTKRTRAAATVSLALAAALGMSGCAAAGSGAAVPADPTKVSGTVNYWSWSGVPTVTPLITAFEKAYPKVKVNYKFIAFSSYTSALRNGLAAGASGPDAYDVQPGALAQQFGPLGLDLTSVAKAALGSNWKSDLAPEAVKAFTIASKLTALPSGSGGAGTLLVNKSMLDSMGLQVPTSTTTLSQWLDLCKAVEAKGVDCLAQGAKDEWVDQDVFQSIADSTAPGKYSSAVAGKTKWTDSDLVKALTTWGDLFHNGIIQPGALGLAEYPDATNIFYQQKAAMVAIGTWAETDFTKTGNASVQSGAGVSNPKGFTEVLTGFPDVAGSGSTIPIFADANTGTAVNPKSKNEAAAEAFAAWLTIKPSGGAKIAADQLSVVPILKGVTANPSALNDPATQTNSISYVTKGVSESSEARDIAYPDLVTALGNALQAVAAGTATPAQAAATLQAASAAVQR